MLMQLERKRKKSNTTLKIHVSIQNMRNHAVDINYRDDLRAVLFPIMNHQVQVRRIHHTEIGCSIYSEGKIKIK